MEGLGYWKPEIEPERKFNIYECRERNSWKFKYDPSFASLQAFVQINCLKSICLKMIFMIYEKAQPFTVLCVYMHLSVWLKFQYLCQRWLEWRRGGWKYFPRSQWRTRTKTSQVGSVFEVRTLQKAKVTCSVCAAWRASHPLLFVWNETSLWATEARSKHDIGDVVILWM